MDMFVDSILKFTNNLFLDSDSYQVYTNDECMFQRTQPTVSILLVYGLAVPTLAMFGLCTNFINAMVFMRPKMTPSAFTYLAALSWLDCVSCLLITLTAVSRSYFYRSAAWIAFDYQWQTPLFGISTGAANLILACVSLDRFIYLSRFKRTNGAPKFCRRKVARFMICVVMLVSVLVNLPYFFIFVVDLETATCHVTDFYYSKFYLVHNWFSFALLALLPAVFLLIGNTAIIIAFCRWTKQSKLCQFGNCNDNTKTTHKRYQHQMKLTISIVIVITLYMVGELPAHMTSRKSSLNLLFGGDVSKVDLEHMERLEVIFITLNALQLSMNIVVYAVINPSFMPEFFLCLRHVSDTIFRFLCVPNITRGCQRCCSCCSSSEQLKGEERVVSTIAPLPLPMDDAAQCGCETWSGESASDDDSHCKALEAAFIFDFKMEGKEPEPQAEVFTTKSSACVQLMEQSADDESQTSSYISYP